MRATFRPAGAAAAIPLTAARAAQVRNATSHLNRIQAALLAALIEAHTRVRTMEDAVDGAVWLGQEQAWAHALAVVTHPVDLDERSAAATRLLDALYDGVRDPDFLLDLLAAGGGDPGPGGTAMQARCA